MIAYRSIVQSNLSRLPASPEIMVAMRIALTLSTLEMRQLANQELERQFKGNPIERFDLQVQIDELAMTGTVGTEFVGARAQELGAEIEPVTANVLHFTIDGQEIFARHVTLPARPYLGPAWDQAEATARREIEAALLVRGFTP